MFLVDCRLTLTIFERPLNIIAEVTVARQEEDQRGGWCKRGGCRGEVKMEANDLPNHFFFFKFKID